MNRLARWTLRLYPSAWRARYGDEVDALLTDAGADARIVMDLFKGGIRMHFSRRSFFMLALSLGIGGALLGFVSSFLITQEYRSMATMRLTPAAIKVENGKPLIDIHAMDEAIQQMRVAIYNQTSLGAIATSLNLYNVQHPTRPIEDVIEEMRRNMGIQFISLPGALQKRASAFDIVFTYPDPMQAHKTVLALMAAFDRQNDEISKTAPDRFHAYVLDVLDTASMPVSPVSPGRLPMSVTGGLVGLIVAGIIAFVRRARTLPSPAMLATNE